MSQKNQRIVVTALQDLCSIHSVTPYDVIDRYMTENTNPVERAKFCIAQASHAITNLPVEWLRKTLPEKLNPEIEWFGASKDAAYWLGHGLLVAVLSIPFALALL